jgi:hypothetical protein
MLILRRLLALILILVTLAAGGIGVYLTLFLIGSACSYAVNSSCGFRFSDLTDEPLLLAGWAAFFILAFLAVRSAARLLRRPSA